VRINERWGFIDRSGGFVIEPKFELAESFSFKENILEGAFAKVILDWKVCFVNTKGEIVLKI
jgi:hypothetical protein